MARFSGGSGGGSGVPGPRGPEGDSAYDVAVANGFEGTEQEWLDSLGSSGSSADIADFIFTAPDENSSFMELDGKVMVISSAAGVSIRSSNGEVNISSDNEEDISLTASEDLYLSATGDDIHIRAGDDIRFSANNQNSEEVETWRMNANGRFELPGNGAIANPPNSSGDGNGNSTLHLAPDADLYSSASDQYIVLDPTAPNHIHIRAGGTADESLADLFLGGEETNVVVSDTSNSVVISGSGGAFLNNSNPENQIATLSDIGIETDFVVVGGATDTQPTFTGDPLFSGSYVRMSSNLVYFQIQVDFDNITSFGSGQYYVDLPFPAKHAYELTSGCLHDISTGRDYPIAGHVFAGESRLYLESMDVAGQTTFNIPFTATAPITLDVADNFHIAGTYIAEVAL
jgi:hypothetical protein